MTPTTSHTWIARGIVLLVTLSPCHPVTLSSAHAESPATEDERTLHDAGLPADGASLLAFFHARARTGIDPDRIRVLVRQFAALSQEERGAATAELLGLGALALPALRQTANDLDHPDVATRAARCLPWLEGPSSRRLLIAAANLLGRRAPEGAAAALLDYLPAADDPEVNGAVSAALAAVAAPAGKADPALVRGLEDPVGVRRAAAVVALCLAAPPDQTPAVRKLLHDPAPAVRLRAALALGEAYDAEAIPVLIDLLADLPAEQRAPVEEFLTQLAGEWAPVLQLALDDEVSRRIRRDAWSAWWRHTDGATLTAALRKHTPTAEDRKKIHGLIDRLGDEDFAQRERASLDLFAVGRMALPQLQEATRSTDAEVSRRVRELIERIQREPAHVLPAAAIRLLAVRKPAGAVETLLAYLPYADDEVRAEEVSKSLTLLALREGKPDPALLGALRDAKPEIRAVAVEALARGGGAEGRAEARKLLQDATPSVRLRAALALAMAREGEGVPVLIDLLTVLPLEQVGLVEDALFQLAGDTAPEVSLGEKAEERKKCRDAWAAWWKINAQRADLGRLTARLSHGYTVICNDGSNRILEVDRHGKERWAIEGVQGPVDVLVLPGGRVLVAECNASRVTERNLKGNILWQKQVNGPVNVQRFRNGNTFIAGQGHITEVDRAGTALYAINNVPGGVLAAYRSRRGTIICLTNDGRCHTLDTTGKLLKSFRSGHDQMCLGGLDLLPNGHILVPQPGRNCVVEFDAEGRKVREVGAPGATMATELPNGHFLAAGRNTSKVFEVDRAGKIVWERQCPGQVFRARRR
jgi:HEAT repeat protein